MNMRNRNLRVFFRTLIWLTYLLSGVFLYSVRFFLPQFLETFAKLFYPLSIFWLQIRIKNKEPWLPLTNSMSTSQLWFRLIPILASLFTSIIVLVNLLFKISFIFIK